MRKNTNQVEIKEPPIGGLKKKKSCLSKTCFGGCGCIVILIFGCLIALKLASQPRTKELKELPAVFTENIPLYDEKSINKIEFLSGKKRNDLIEKILFIPKTLIAPVLVELEKIQNKGQSGQEKITSYFDWGEIKNKINTPITDQRDIYRLDWTELPAQPSFIQNYYKTELKKKDFIIDISSSNEVVNQFTFKKENISGVLYIKDDLIADGTDYVLLIINMPSK